MNPYLNFKGNCREALAHYQQVLGARLLFQVMSNCYERQSMVLTTNIEFGKWGAVLADDKLASALVDRIVHHGRLVEFKGESRRVADSLMLGNRKEG